MDRTRHGPRRGQGLTEYVIVVGLIACALVAAVRAWRGVLERTYGAATAQVEAVAVDIEAGLDAGTPAMERGTLEVEEEECDHSAGFDPDTRRCRDCDAEE